MVSPGCDGAGAPPKGAAAGWWRCRGGGSALPLQMPPSAATHTYLITSHAQKNSSPLRVMTFIGLPLTAPL